MQKFQSFGLSEQILQGVRAVGYTTPTPIQAAAIPLVLSGGDVIGCAQTGTGKTAAFVLPLLDRLLTSRSRGTGRSGPRPVRALVVTPTRELALQVEESVRTYGTHTPLRSLTIFGGVGMGPQIQGLRRGADIVVATPGRLLDHMDRGNIDLSQVEILVLDEADRMLDMGFIRDIRKIVAEVPKRRQTLLFSATMPPEVRELANTILHQPEFVEIGQRRNPAESVVQQVCAVHQQRKMDLLVHLLQTEPIENVIVFSRTKHRADRIARKLGNQGFAVTVMHSNRSQSQRQRALDGLKGGRFNILVATDIAARGIDVDGVSHVINFDIPNGAEDYIHHIGRTGRADATGDAVTFIAPEDVTSLRDIERHIGQPIGRKVYDGFDHVALPETAVASNGGSRNGGGNRSRNRGGRRR